MSRRGAAATRQSDPTGPKRAMRLWGAPFAPAVPRPEDRPVTRAFLPSATPIAAAARWDEFHTIDG